MASKNGHQRSHVYFYHCWFKWKFYILATFCESCTAIGLKVLEILCVEPIYPQYSGVLETCLALRYWFFEVLGSESVKISKVAKIRNRYNQVPHLTQDTETLIAMQALNPFKLDLSLCCSHMTLSLLSALRLYTYHVYSVYSLSLSFSLSFSLSLNSE